jgi:hypothetical protein
MPESKPTQTIVQQNNVKKNPMQLKKKGKKKSEKAGSKSNKGIEHTPIVSRLLQAERMQVQRNDF